jgi:hypothetical protein
MPRGGSISGSVFSLLHAAEVGPPVACRPGKWISVFINTTMAKQLKKSMVKGIFDFFNAQGGSLAISDGLHQCRKIDICFYHHARASSKKKSWLRCF